LTDSNPTGNKYSTVVSLCSMRIAIAASELNELDIKFGDVSSAYPEAYTQEKVCFIAGPEFRPLEGHQLVIGCAIYGLRTSGAQWHDLYANVMRIMDFYPCKADPNVWMKYCDTHYECGLVYVNELMFICKKPQAFIDYLTTEHSSKLESVGKPSYHLGGDFYCDYNGSLAWGAQLYVENNVNQLQNHVWV
jgi:hypothetical protein